MEEAGVDVGGTDESDRRAVRKVQDGVAALLGLRGDDLLGSTVQLSGEADAALLRSADGVETGSGSTAADAGMTAARPITGAAGNRGVGRGDRSQAEAAGISRRPRPCDLLGAAGKLKMAAVN